MEEPYVRYKSTIRKAGGDIRNVWKNHKNGIEGPYEMHGRAIRKVEGATKNVLRSYKECYIIL